MDSSKPNPFDIHAIRDQLNEVAFKDGTRSICLGSVVELFEDQDADVIQQALRELELQLRRRDLHLEHGDGERLYVTQQLKRREVDPAWMAKGIEWVSKITTVALEMVVPVVVGSWLDQRFETQFLTLLGIAIGIPLGLWHLIKMTNRGE